MPGGEESGTLNPEADGPLGSGGGTPRVNGAMLPSESFLTGGLQTVEDQRRRNELLLADDDARLAGMA